MAKSKTQERKDSTKYLTALQNIEWLEPTSKTILHKMEGINRKVEPSHVTKIANSIQAIQEMLRPIVVVVTSALEGVKRHYILDGQHSSDALDRLGSVKPIVKLYSEDQAEIVEWMAKLNNSSKPWALIDYINAWKTLPGHEDYITLLKAFNTFDLPIILLVQAYANLSRTGSTMSMVKSGRFKVVNLVRGEEILKDVADLFSVLKGERQTRFIVQKFCEQYISWRHIVPNYRHKEFLKYLEIHKKEFALLVNTPDATKELLEKFK